MRAMSGLQFIDMKRAAGMMWMIGVNETTDRVAMASSVHCYGHVLRREDGLILRGALDCQVECLRKNGRPRRTRKMQVDRGSITIGLNREDALSQSKWIVVVDLIAPGLR